MRREMHVREIAQSTWPWQALWLCGLLEGRRRERGARLCKAWGLRKACALLRPRLLWWRWQNDRLLYELGLLYLWLRYVLNGLLLLLLWRLLRQRLLGLAYEWQLCQLSCQCLQLQTPCNAEIHFMKMLNE